MGKKKSKKKIFIALIVGYFALLFFFIYRGNVKNEWKGKLDNPTQIQKVGEDYFIVDSGHNRVIYEGRGQAPLRKYKLKMS